MFFTFDFKANHGRTGSARLHLLQCRLGWTLQNRDPVTHSWCSAESRLSHGDFFRNEVVSCLLKFSKSICSSGAVMTAGAEPLRVFCPLGLSKTWNGPNFHQVTNIFPVCRYEHCLSAVCRSTLNRGSFTFSLDHLR